jgi:hypothetical protein
MRTHAQRTTKKGWLLLALLATLIATMALAASSASASPFCGGQQFNNANKCWGAGRTLEYVKGWGTSTGVCVGADTTQGNCAPKETWSQVWIGGNGFHYPWIIGTASAFTTCGECYTLF